MPEARHYDASLCETRKNSQAIICHSELVSESINAYAKEQEAGSNRVEQLNDKSLSSYHPTFLSSRPAPTQPPSQGRRNVAFTLAEVLITLGIIGVVAALTLPTLMANQRKKEVETKLKKVYSVMNQAINLSVVEYGDFMQWGGEGECGLTSENNCATSDETKATFNKYIGKHLQNITIEPRTADSAGIMVYFSDGTVLSVTNYVRDMYFYINKKALDNPQSGVNAFNFRFSPKPETGVNGAIWGKSHVGKGFEPYSYAWDGTRDGLFHGIQGYGCGEKLSMYCTKLIQQNGWEIPEDYPLKF